MKVLFITHSFPRFDGDAPGSFLLRLAQSLTPSGAEVRVLAPSGPGLARSDTIAGVPVRRFRYAPSRLETLAYGGTMVDDVRGSARGKLTFAGFLGAEMITLLDEINQFAPDVLHAHWWFPNGVIAAGAAWLTDTPLVTTCHGTDARLLRTGRAAGAAARWVFNRSARVTCVSNWLADEIEPYCATRPAVAPMPIAIDIFEPGDGGARFAAGTLPRLLFVGRLSTQKGIRAALRVVAMMRTKAALDVVGDGPDRAALTRLASDMGIESRVLWHGALPQPALADLYSGASALLAPFVDEGLGLVAAEAQLCETPVIAYDSGGLRDVVTDGETGLMVAPGDEAGLAAAADRLLSDPALRSDLGRAGRARALATFAPATAAARYAAIYRDALRAHVKS